MNHHDPDARELSAALHEAAAFRIRRSLHRPLLERLDLRRRAILVRQRLTIWYLHARLWLRHCTE